MTSLTETSVDYASSVQRVKEIYNNIEKNQKKILTISNSSADDEEKKTTLTNLISELESLESQLSVAQCQSYQDFEKRLNLEKLGTFVIPNWKKDDQSGESKLSNKIKNPNGATVNLKSNEDISEKTIDQLNAEMITIRGEIIRLNNLYRQLSDEEISRKQLCESALKQRENELLKKKNS
eukprot:gene299-6713_t